MSTAATRHEYTAGEMLVMAFELGQKEWKLAFGTGFDQSLRTRTVRGGDAGAVREQVAAAKEHYGLAADAPVYSCYEAGREGFWLHRFVRSVGIVNHVIDSSSIQVDRRQRRAKTDRIDAAALVTLLIRHLLGEKGVFSVVRVPSVEDEDARSLHRELQTLKKERTRSSNRIKGLLLTQGIRYGAVGSDLPEELGQMKLWDGRRLPAGIRGRIEREYERMQTAQAQIRQLEGERLEAIREGEAETLETVRKLHSLKAIGPAGSWLLTMEFFAWRKFRNVKEVGALAGLTPTPYQSGDDEREQGISKAGNRYVRRMMIELAWSWLRWQPDSELSRWYIRRFGQAGKRAQKVGIVALARKLLVALYKYLEFDEVPEGAVMKS